MKPAQFQRVIFQPAVYQGMQRGIDQMVAAVRPTLGPFPHWVAIEQNQRGKLPELVDNGGLIMRRVVALPDRDADIGAMLIRHMVWQVHENVGDGTVTAAILFQSVFNQGVRYVTAGGNAMRLRGALERGMGIILNELDRQKVFLRGKHQLTQVAETLCYDPALSRILGEIFDIIGEYGRLDIRPGQSREIEREYLEGAYWQSNIFSRELVRDVTKLRSELQNVAILISDLEIEDPRLLVPVLEGCLQAGAPSLLLLAQKISDPVIALLLSASRDSGKFQAAAYKTPGATPVEQAAWMSDLAVLTGGRIVCQAAGESLKSVRFEDLGRARRAWAEYQHFGVTGGRGDPRRLRAHLANLRIAAGRAKEKADRDLLEERIGKLMGGAASLMVGGLNENEINARVRLAEQAAQTLRTVVRDGVVPGGGAALLACQPALARRMKTSPDEYECVAFQILHTALETPIRAILANAGFEPGFALAAIGELDGMHGFDVRRGRVINMGEAGIWDAAAVVKAAVHGAVASAALALTTDVLVHHKKPELKINP